jgi:hypothetical protein
MTLKTLKNDLKMFANICFKLIKTHFFFKYFTLFNFKILHKFIKTYKLHKI